MQIAFLFVIIFYLAIMSLIFISFWKICVKAGREGWEGILPIYNYYVFLQIAKKPTWWLGMFFIPIVNIVFLIKMMDGISKAFGKESGFTVGLVLLGIVFFPILAFGDAQYVYSDERPKNDDLLDSW
ncbi:MAG: hypothetical protein ACI837_001476 [Crocinitomicaceae bacterium]|jgi:hypothetical protein